MCACACGKGGPEKQKRTEHKLLGRGEHGEGVGRLELVDLELEPLAEAAQERQVAVVGLELAHGDVVAALLGGVHELQVVVLLLLLPLLVRTLDLDGVPAVLPLAQDLLCVGGVGAHDACLLSRGWLGGFNWGSEPAQFDDL